MKPSLYLVKRELGRTFENPKTEVHFIIVDSDISKDYPLNFICVLPQGQSLVSGHSAFRRIFGEDSVPLAKRLLSKSLFKERDLEINTEVGKRLKMLAPKNVVNAKCRVCGNLFVPKRFAGHYQKNCQDCASSVRVNLR
jgi:hypothetical protein